MDEGTQDVILQLRSTTTYVIGGTGIATVNITDNDASQVYLKLTQSAVTEPASGIDHGHHLPDHPSGQRHARSR